MILPAINTISKLGPARISERVMRLLRYRYLYPLMAKKLFPEAGTFYKDWGNSTDFSSFYRCLTRPADSDLTLRKAAELCRHRFAFLNLPQVDLGEPVAWQFMPNNDRLWQYNLHYGEWAQTLSDAHVITKEARFLDSLIRLMNDWIDHNPVCSRPGWEPYPLSRRIVAWSKVAVALQDNEIWNSFWQSRLASSLHRQVRVLAANLEHDLANNHLISNYRALAWFGLLFPGWPGSREWQSIGLNGLWSEMRRQVLPDGVHDERSISYHAIVVQDLLETCHICRDTGEPLPKDVEPTLRSMLQFLADMAAPDGSYPMLNDTVTGYPLDFRNIVLAGGMLFKKGREAEFCGGDAELQESVPLEKSPFPRSPMARNQQIMEEATKDRGTVSVFPEAGYVVLRDDKESCLYFDAGSMGPDHLPGHGHADALGFVLYGRGKPLIIDPGVYSYHDLSWRNHFRSTSAHNTVAIDGQNQCVFWGTFRVAYPPKVRLIDWSEDRVVGEHEGYVRLTHPVIHRRSIERTGHGKWEIEDRFEGKGIHDFSLTLQFSPDALINRGDKETSVIWPGGISLTVEQLLVPPKSKIVIEKGWVSSAWNIKEEAPRYMLQWRSEVPVQSKLILKIV